MAIKYGFFNSVAGDRAYSARDLEKTFNLIISDGIIANENGLSESLKVKYYSNLQLRVVAGNGIFGGHWMEMNADEIITIPTPHTQYTRIDSVVVRVDEDSRTISLEYIQGTPSASPQAPTIQRSESVKEYRLANISVAANTTSVTQSNITDTRPSADCGVVTNLLQNSDISATYSQWESQFNDFLDSKNEEFTNRLDAISGLDANSILALQEDVVDIKGDISTLENVVDTATAKANSATTAVDNLSTIANKNKSDITALDTRLDKLEIDTSKVLWNGGNVMGSGASIKPSKKLSECKNGYVLAWCGWNGSTYTNTRFNFVQVSKNVLESLPGNDIPLYCNLISSIYESGRIDYAAKRVDVYDDKINGFVGNTATDLNNGMCLRFVLEY